MTTTYHDTTFYRMMKDNEKNGMQLRIDLDCRDQSNRSNSKNVGQRSSAANHKTHFLVLPVLAIHSTVQYPLPISVNNKIKNYI